VPTRPRATETEKETLLIIIHYKMKHFTRFLKKGMVAIAALLMCAPTLTVQAQNVTVSPSTGSLIAALTIGSESGFEAGYSAMWRHEQLPLTFTVSDFCNLTEGGEFVQPAGNMTANGNYLVVDGGRSPDSYMCLSLPKGYRFTGYTIVLANNLVGQTVNETNHGSSAQKIFYETNDLSRHASTTSMNYANVSDDEQYNTILSEIQANNPNYLAVAKKKSNDSYVMPGSRETGASNYYTITRTSKSEEDMDNHLYFRMSHSSSSGIYGVTIISFEVYFTAEGTFAADVKPDTIGVARSVVTSPFKTSKIDIGKLTRQTKNGKTYFAYSYQNVRDLDAYTYLYQQNAVENGVPYEGEEEKHIYPVRVDGNDLYAFDNDTYYIETPIQVHTQSGLESPVGYRIVGARFNYLWGTPTEGGTQTLTNAYYITATRDNSTYYLNDQLQFTRNQFAWAYDPETKNLYTGTGSNIRYLACSGRGDSRTLTTSSENGGYYNLIVFNRNNTNYIGWDNETASQRFYLRYYSSGFIFTSWNIAVTRNNTSNAATASVADTETIHFPDFTPGTYTLNVYDKTGTTIERTIDVTESNAGGILELDSLNNDAVKFQITGLEEGKQALVSVTLEMQALNPYIDKMDIVCHDPDKQLKLSQPFTANDFSVSGGKFTFYIPEEYQNTELTFTFSDLYSHDGDKTYYTGTADQKNGNSRYSFVTSEYFYPINGNGNDGLYDANYSPDATYTNKVFTSTAGNIRFKFNNAEDLSNTGAGTASYLEETPFSVAAYLTSTDPDNSGATGKFNEVKLKASNASQKSGTYYVFTADETRYNIAPTKAWQHRYYAFYRMEIELKAKTYTPDLKWTKVYDQSLSGDESGNPVTKSQWGLKLGTKDGNNVVTGYLTVKEINDAITAALGKADCPESADQILYIDASELYSIVSSTDITLERLKNTLGANALFYLPANTTSTLDNFAYKTTSGSFRAGKDIVLTDKKPFYAPYDIQVNTANVAKFNREVTVDKYGKTDYVSMILPFGLTTVDGTHTNTTADGCKFKLYQMNENDCLEITQAQVAEGNNYFSEDGISKQTPFAYDLAPANTPFLVDVEQGSEEDGTIFVVAQEGALVKATSAMGSDYTFTGETGNGTYLGNGISFTNHGGFAGTILDVAGHNQGYYYIGRANKLVCSDNLRADMTELKLLPFRTYYTSTKSGAGSNALMQFNIVFGKNENSDQTGISRIENVKENGAVYDLQGRRVVNPTKGLYIVNGKKVMVK
jgi:hypothetical protein